MNFKQFLLKESYFSTLKIMTRHTPIPIFLLMLNLFFGSCLSAQPYFDVANIHYINSPTKSFVNAKNNASSIEYLSAQIGLPVKLHEDILLFNPFYENYTLQFFEQYRISNSFNSIGLPVTFLKQWKKEKWKTAFVFIPRINSDFEDIGGNHYQIGGAVLAIYKKTENLRYKFGLYYNSEFFGPFFMPLLGIDWNINNRTNLFGVLPGNLTLEYKINSTFYGGINFKSITNSYRFGESTYLKIADNYVKLFLDYYPVKNFAISIEAGHTVLRKYSIGHDNILIRQNQLKDGLLLKAGLAYRIRLVDKK